MGKSRAKSQGHERGRHAEGRVTAVTGGVGRRVAASLEP